MHDITGISLTMDHTKVTLTQKGFITGGNVINYKIKGRILRCNFWKVLVGGVILAKKVAPKLTQGGQSIKMTFHIKL